MVISGWEVPPNPFTGEGGYSTTDPTAAFKPGAKPVYYTSGGSSQAQLNAEADARRKAREQAERLAEAQEKERLQKEIYQRQINERQAQAQAEAKRVQEQAEAKRFQEQVAKQKYVEAGAIKSVIQKPISSKVVSISDPNKYYRTKEYGQQVAKYETAIQKEAQSKGRNLTKEEKKVIEKRIIIIPEQTIQRDIQRERAVEDYERARERETQILPGTTGTAGGGLLFVTPQEKELITKKGGTTLPIYETFSPSTVSGMVQAINIEAPFAGTVTPSQVGAPATSFFAGRKVLSAEEQQYNIRQIKRARESAKELALIDKRIREAKPEEDIQRLYAQRDLIVAKIQERYERDYTPTEIYKARAESKGGLTVGFASAETGAEKVGIGLAEGLIDFTTKLGVQTIKFDESGKLIPQKKFSFGLDISKIPSEPSAVKFTEKPLAYVGEALLERPTASFTGGVIGGTITILGTGAIKNIGELGLKGGIIETSRVFSPIRIPSGIIYAPDISKTKFEGQAVKIQKGEISETYFRGKGIGDTDVKLGVYQISGKNIGVSAGVVEFPQYTIPRGSASLVEGTGTTTFLSSITGKPSGLFGFIGEAKTIPIMTTSVFPGQATANIITNAMPTTTKVGGVEISDKNLFAFAGGKVTQGFYRTGLKDLTFAKTTKVNIRGIGVKVNIPTEPDVTFIGKGGGGKTITKLTSTETPLVIEVPKISPTITTTGLGAGVSGTTKVISQKPTSALSSVLLSATKPVQDIFEGRISTGTLGVLSTRFISGEKQKEETKLIQEEKQRGKEALVSTSSLLTGLVTKPTEEYRQPSALAQPQRISELQKQQQEQVLAMISPIITPTISPPRITYPEEIGGFDFGFLRKKKKKEDEGIYDAYVLRESTKPTKRRWVKVADNVTRKTGLSIAGGEVDNSISSRFKVVRDTKAKKLSAVEDSSWDNISYKFREYKQKGGVKIQTPMQFIEKIPFRIDTEGEKRKLKIERQTSSLLFGGSKNSRSKRKSISIKRMFGI